MQNPKTFLIEKMINCDNNGLKTLGSLKTVYVEDLTTVLTEFAEATALELVGRLVEGETVYLSDGRTVYLEHLKKRKKGK
jgi:hypothetical protein